MNEEIDPIKRDVGQRLATVRQLKGYTTPISTSCNRIGNYVNCQQTGGQYTPPATMDTNAIARAVEVRQCLQAKGYTPQ